MGYTHYWDRPQTITPKVFHAIAADFLKILPALELVGVQLGNAWGRKLPEIGPEFIGFNGAESCGHDKNVNVRLPWPAERASGIGDNHGIGGTLTFRTCNGDCSYESVWFERSMPADQADANGGFSGVSKTAFRPYDLALNALLVIAQHHLGRELIVRTDGEQPQWEEAQKLCQQELAYGAEFRIDSDRRLVTWP